MGRTYLLTLFLLGSAILCGCYVEDDRLPPPVDDFSLDRYMGLWYEAGRSSNPFQKGMTDVTALYTLQKDGSVSVMNRGMLDGKSREIHGVAKMRSFPERGDLLVSFFRPFYSLYRIVLLGKDYQYSVVLSSGGKYLWILSRSRNLSEKDRGEILDFLKKWNLPEVVSPVR